MLMDLCDTVGNNAHVPEPVANHVGEVRDVWLLGAKATK